ncbi:MAG: HAMP domain-containing histidine kinase [Bacteroidales bacterium]|nr:HAMP domain-containing histidine kinase [Clostridium sp.]MCM1204931.1 HAMP domain-containing histidine kinase [Bacteroidales bacterium]
MDWIDEAIEKWRNKLSNASLRKALVSYLVMAVLLTFLAVAVTVTVCSSLKNVMREVNGVNVGYRYIGEGEFVIEDDHSRTVIIGRNVRSLDKRDRRMWAVLSGIEVLCIPVYSVAAILLVSVLYYRNKLAEPMFLLRKEMEAIMQNDLSFSCWYGSADEMGDICRVMDSMRQSVVNNQKIMWELMEEQRTINAAFAHDLRTPLTVITGYVDMLMEYYPKGKVDGKKLLAILSSIRGQTVRMSDFSETMKGVHSVEALEVERKQHTGEELEREIRNMAEGLEGKNGLSISVSAKLSGGRLYYDNNVLMEVLGNLLSNAMRYGKRKIEILAEQQEDRLFLYVRDDGRGMTSEELYRADSPYYSDKTEKRDTSGADVDGKEADRDTHFGLGLTISKILCKKHGGKISFSNSIEGGAIVCAEFAVK